MCGSCSRPLVCPTRHDHGDREQSPGTRRTVPQADTCTATRHDLVRATSPAPGPHRPPSSARSPPVRPRRPLIQRAMRTVYSPALPPVDLPVMKQLPPRHSDPLLRFYHLLAVLELVHRLRVVPACLVVVPVTQDVEDPFGIDGFCQDFGGHLSELRAP